jgi:choline-sulfatase
VTRLPTPLGLDKPTLAKQLRKAGYRTAVFGKMHFQRPGEPGLHGFEECVTEDVSGRRWRAEVKPRAVAGGIRTKPAWRPFKDPARVWLNADKLPYPRWDADMQSSYTVRLAERYMEEHREEPFALWVSLMEPHSPFDFSVEDRDVFDARRFTAPRVGEEDGEQVPLIFRDLTEEDKRGIAAACYTSTYFVDRNMGRVLDRLRALKLEQDTLVVYVGDNGYQLGEHGRFEKHCGYEESLRVPLLMRWPGKVRRGVVRDLVEFVDVAPTVLDLLGAERLKVEHGRSLRGYVEGGDRRDPHRMVLSEYLENEEAYLWTERWKLTYCTGKRARGDGYKTERPTPGRYRRLYDLEADAGEFRNVAAREPGVVEELERAMLERFRGTHPEAGREPRGLSREEALDWYLRPRDV